MHAFDYATGRLANIEGLQDPERAWRGPLIPVDSPSSPHQPASLETSMPLPALTDLASAHALFAAVQARADARGVALRAPPSEPTSCCGRGCNGCVWEGYYEAVVYWRDEALLMLEE